MRAGVLTGVMVYTAADIHFTVLGCGLAAARLIGLSVWVETAERHACATLRCSLTSCT